MRALAIDTALSACSAGVVAHDADEPIAAETVAMERGHAEALLPLVDRVMARIEGRFAALDRVAVTIGPGSLLQVLRTMPRGSIHQGVVEVPERAGISGALMAYMQESEQVASVISVCTQLDGDGDGRVCESLA